MFNNIIKNNSVLENKKSKTLLYTIATLITLTLCSGSNEVYAMNIPALNNQVQNIRTARIRTDKFTPEEDQMIMNEVSNLESEFTWKKIAEKLGNGRNSYLVRRRYEEMKSLEKEAPQWTTEEDKFLISCVGRYGNKWSIIEKFFPGRTMKDVRIRYLTKDKFLSEEQVEKLAKIRLKYNLDIQAALEETSLVTESFTQQVNFFLTNESMKFILEAKKNK